MERIPELKMIHRWFPSLNPVAGAKVSAPRAQTTRRKSREPKELNFSVRVWKGKHSLQDQEEFMVDSVPSKISSDSFEDGGSISFRNASNNSGFRDDSNWSNLTGCANKPQKGNDPRWKAILAIRARYGSLGMSHFRLLKRCGCGDIGSVYLSELSGTLCFFAMKVMDKVSFAAKEAELSSDKEGDSSAA